MKQSTNLLWRQNSAMSFSAGAVCILLAACAGPQQRPVSLEAAEAAFTSARADTDVQRLAPRELARAADVLQQAEAALRNDAGVEEIDHLAYLIERRTDIAKAAAEEDLAKESMDELAAERDRVQLEARTREAQTAEQEADAAERQAALANQKAKKAEAELERLRRELKAEKDERGLVVTLGSILFDVDSAKLKPGGVQQLSRVAEFLSGNPERNLLIEGHTDSSGSDAHNLDLSSSRANSVEAVFLRQGVSGSNIAARGYGERFPVANNQTAAGRQQNRRVEVVILDEGKSLPPPRVGGSTKQ